MIEVLEKLNTKEAVVITMVLMIIFNFVMNHISMAFFMRGQHQNRDNMKTAIKHAIRESEEAVKKRVNALISALGH